MQKQIINALYSLFNARSWKKRLTSLTVLIGIASVWYRHELPRPNQAKTVYGKIVGVADGDTVTLLTQENQSIRIRLAYIDAPEKSQAYGMMAKKHLSKLLYNQVAEVCVKNVDRYGRTIGHIFIGKKDINLSQVAAGYAWHYTTYAKKMQSKANFATYTQAQNKAKQRRLGLWQDPNPVPPWIFRRTEKRRKEVS